MFSNCPVQQHYVPPLSETVCFSTCLFKVPPPEYPVSSDWSPHTGLSQHSNSCAKSILLLTCVSPNVSCSDQIHVTVHVICLPIAISSKKTLKHYLHFCFSYVDRGAPRIFFRWGQKGSAKILGWPPKRGYWWVVKNVPSGYTCLIFIYL